MLVRSNSGADGITSCDSDTLSSGNSAAAISRTRGVASARASSRFRSPAMTSVAFRGSAVRFQNPRTVAESSCTVLMLSPPMGR